MQKLLLFSFLLISALSCNSREVDELYIQRIEGSSVVIYDYSASGGLDTIVQGYAIQDSTIPFKIHSVKELPISNFLEIPNSNSIETAHTITPKDKEDISLDPIEKDSMIVNNIQVNLSIYERYQGETDPSCNLTSYNFQNFKETSDSLFFYGITESWDSTPELTDGAGFKKGNIKLVGRVDGTVGRIVIEEFVKTLGERKIYKYGSNELERIETDKPIVCITSYYFNPENELNQDQFTDYGIFKRIK